MAHIHVSYGPGLICHRVASVGAKTGTKQRRASPIQKTGCTAHLRLRALTPSIDCLSPEIYGKGSEPGRFAYFAHKWQCSSAVAETILNKPGIGSLVGKREATCMA